MEPQKVYIEIRGATGGDEAKIWGSDLLRMYYRYAIKKNWKASQVSDNTLLIVGAGAFDALKNESGVHRVQRVPTTEKRGRIHTSTATVVAAVRLIHRPSGIVVEAREERFQEANRQIALNLLRSRLWEREEERKMKEIADYRSPIGRGMRAEKIRTYNYPQDRITDHRIGKSWGNLTVIVDGALDKVLELTKNIN
jgi:peptide chain release factor 1